VIGPYLGKREQLAGLVVIMDIRRPLTDLDLRLIDWFRPTGGQSTFCCRRPTS
jgi:GTP-binding protein